MPISRLVTAHFRQLVNLEGVAFVALRRVYEQFAEEAQASLDESSGESFTDEHRAAILIQVQTALDVMATTAVETLAERFLDAANTGARQSLAEIRDLEARFGSAEFLARIDVLPPIIPAESVSYIAQPGNLALTNFREATAERVADALAQSVLQGESIADAKRRLSAEMPAHNWELERIARTEIGSAMNFGHDATIQRVAADFPEMQLQKRWSSHFDDRTSAVCRSLGENGGQVRDVGQDFETSAGGGWRGAYPPGHPNCRSRVLPYSPRWEKRATEAGKAFAGPATCLHTFALFQGPCSPSQGAKARDMTNKKHETKSFQMEFKALDDPGTFSGYASVFGNVDQGNDMVHPGAFKRTLNAYRQSKKRIPLLYGHETGLREVVGYIDPDDLQEDGRGLRLTKGVLMIDKLEAARTAYALMQEGVLTDMSFGYDAVKKDWTGNVRNLREVKLYEVSLVLWPMNEESNVTDVKSAPAASSKAADFATILRREVVQSDLCDKRWKMNSALSDAIHGALCDAEVSEADAMSLIDDSLTQYHAEMMAWARTALASGIYTEAKGEGPDEIKIGRRFSAATIAHINGAVSGAETFIAEMKALLADPAAKDPDDDASKGAAADSEAKGAPGPAETPATDPVDHSARLLNEVRTWKLTA